MLAMAEPNTYYALPRDDDGIMELSLMMSKRQFDALEKRARSQSMSVAQYLRRLVQESIDQDVPLGWHG